MTLHRPHRLPLGLVAALVVSLLAAAPGSASTQLPGCADPGAPGGEWRSYGHDLHNTRHQPDEAEIDAERARELTGQWVFATADSAPFYSTPIVADGCVYAGTPTGNVYALNADTGDLVWTREIAVSRRGQDGVIVGAPAVEDGRVIVHISEHSSPSVLALDQATGDTLWQTVVDTEPGSYIDAGVVLFDGMVLTGVSGLENSPKARGAIVLLEAATGRIIKKTWTIDDLSYEAGYGGASVWATGAVDAEDGYAYFGGGNPASKKIEHKHANALLKFDVDRTRATFGEIVASYKGQVDQYFPGLTEQPACQYFGEDPRLQYYGSGVWSAPCLQLDLDFGASPNLWVDDAGRKHVGALQKSGVYHSALAPTMDKSWTQVLGLPCFACNAGSTAYDGERIYGVAVPPGQMFALDPNTGFVEWVTPVGSPLHFQATSAANGVVYTADFKGFLNAYDAATGAPLLQRRIASDTGTSAGGNASNGIAIARNTVYVAAGSFIVAYR